MNINGYEAIPGPSPCYPAVWVQRGRYAVRGMQTVSPPSLGRGQVSYQSQCSQSDQDLLPLPWTGLERGGHTEHRTHRLRGNVQLDNSAHAQIIPTQEAVQSKPFKPIGTKLQRGYGDTVGSKIQVYREVSFEFLLRALIRSINLYS